MAGTGRIRGAELGRQAERLAEEYLLRRGYRLLERNYRTRHGEVDLVMEDPVGTVVFVEVKARRTASYGIPEEAVDARKLRRLHRVALSYLQRKGWLERSARLDVVAISWQNDGTAGYNHIENAF